MSTPRSIVSALLGEPDSALAEQARATAQAKLQALSSTMEGLGWTQVRLGTRTDGSVYIIARHPAQLAGQAEEALKAAAIRAGLAVESSVAARRAECAPWQIDATLSNLFG